MFALYLSEVFPEATLEFAYKGDTDSIAEVTDIETDVYHVWVSYKGNIYDGSGQTSYDAIGSWIEEEYEDPNPGVWKDIDPKDAAMLRVIRIDTNWNMDVADFRDKLHLKSSKASFLQRPK
jgi:hypothetical protein